MLAQDVVRWGPKPRMMTMNAPRNLSVLAMTSLFLLAFLPAPAAADHDTCAGHTHVAAAAAVGSVNSGEDDWWVVSVLSTVGAVVLQPVNGDADLAVHTNACSTTPVCTSTAGGTGTDRCTLGQGTWRIRVYYYPSGVESVIYALAVVADDVDVVVSSADAK